MSLNVCSLHYLQAELLLVARKKFQRKKEMDDRRLILIQYHTNFDFWVVSFSSTLLAPIIGSDPRCPVLDSLRCDPIIKKDVLRSGSTYLMEIVGGLNIGCSRFRWHRLGHMWHVFVSWRYFSSRQTSFRFPLLHHWHAIGHRTGGDGFLSAEVLDTFHCVSQIFPLVDR